MKSNYQNVVKTRKEFKTTRQSREQEIMKARRRKKHPNRLTNKKPNKQDVDLTHKKKE